jgi:hypothetical protein
MICLDCRRLTELAAYDERPGGRQRLLQPANTNSFGRGDVIQLRVEANEPGLHRLLGILRLQQEKNDLVGGTKALLSRFAADIFGVSRGSSGDRLTVFDTDDDCRQTPRQHLFKGAGDLTQRLGDGVTVCLIEDVRRQFRDHD